MTTIPDKIAARFWAKVKKTPGCWLWTGARNHKGYGQMGMGKVPGQPMKFMKAHRVAWVLANGPIPDGLWVLHHCDNPQCVRSEPGGKGHLFLGDHQANTDDAVAKGRAFLIAGHRASRGERNGHAILTEDAVRYIRAHYRVDATSQELAARFGVKPNTVRAAARGTFWKSVEYAPRVKPRSRTPTVP